MKVTVNDIVRWAYGSIIILLSLAIIFDVKIYWSTFVLLGIALAFNEIVRFDKDKSTDK